jgi:hypothetical protein
MKASARTAFLGWLRRKLMNLCVRLRVAYRENMTSAERLGSIKSRKFRESVRDDGIDEGVAGIIGSSPNAQL